MNPRRRVDDGDDNGRSSSPDFGGQEAGTGHYTAEYPHKRRRLRRHPLAAPDEVDAGKTEAAAWIASSSCCIDGDVVSDCHVSHAALIRTDVRSNTGQGDAYESR
jgi:hypothetical protein